MESDREYKITQVAKSFKISDQTIRNYEELGKIPNSKRTKGGHRRYTNEHVAALTKLLGLSEAPVIAD